MTNIAGSTNIFPKVEFSEVTAPATPSANRVRMYAKSDGKIYVKDDAGTETLLNNVAAGTGDVVGPSSSTDNVLVRFDSTTGKLIQVTGILVSDNNEISGYRGHFNYQTGTTYTLVVGDAGKIVDLLNASAITLTVPNSLPVGFCCTLIQSGAGAVTVAAGAGATRRNRQGHSTIAGQWGVVSVAVRANAGGSAAEFVFGGDTAT